MFPHFASASAENAIAAAPASRISGVASRITGYSTSSMGSPPLVAAEAFAETGAEGGGVDSRQPHTRIPRPEMRSERRSAMEPPDAYSIRRALFRLSPLRGDNVISGVDNQNRVAGESRRGGR